MEKIAAFARHSPTRRQPGIGWFSATAGFAQLAASVVAGILWDQVGHPSVFLYGAAFGGAGMVALMMLIPRQPARPQSA